MKKVIYIPLDERPCNLLYPQYMLQGIEDIELVTPSEDILSHKKRTADIDSIWSFIEEEAKDAYAIVLSLEMVLYGGLLPSRIHNLKPEQTDIYIENIKNLKRINPNIKIYGFNLIMRTPKYNSSDEEPEYYEIYGERIFKRAYLMDKEVRVGLTEDEKANLKQIISELPKEIFEDYENRRSFNINNNIKILELVKEGTIDFLAIPQDDSSEYGYTAIDQRKVVDKINEGKLQRRVYMYPGADEVGAALIARAISEIRGERLKIYPIFSSTLGPTLIPLYEDRIINESLKSHAMVTNCIIVDSANEADVILAYNTPGKLMQESWEQDNKDITYSSFRNLNFFVDKLSRYLNQGKEIIVADCAFSNGGDLELVSLLDQYEILDKLLSYKGWNTNCNTLGTTLAAGVISYKKSDRDNVKKNLVYHLLEDCFYQAKIRMEITNNILPELGLNYFDLKDKSEVINSKRDKRLLELYNQYIKNSFKDINEIKINSFSPWNRMFECGIDLEVKFNNDKINCLE